MKLNGCPVIRNHHPLCSSRAHIPHPTVPRCPVRPQPKHLHKELREEARKATVRANEAERAAGEVGCRGHSRDDPLAIRLLETAEKWMAATGPLAPAKFEEEATTTTMDNHARFGGLESNCGRSPPGGSPSGGTRSRRRRGSSTQGNGGDAHAKMQAGDQGREHGQRREQHTTARGSGPLAAAAATPARQRELFYALVDALRDYQAENRRNGVVAVDGNVQQNREQPFGGHGSCGAGAGDGRGAGRSNDGVDCSGAELPSIPAKVSSTAAMVPITVGNGGRGRTAGYCGGGSTSDMSSVSVRTLYDFGTPQVCNASTQTIAKVLTV